MSDNAFFSAAEARRVRPLPTLHPRCDHCGLAPGCRSPKMAVDGSGRRRMLIVSDYPGWDEDAAGRPLVEATGRYLEEELERVGLDMRRDCWLTNATICYSDRIRSHKSAVTDCRPNVLRAIRELDPQIILLLGGFAVRSLIGHLWREDVGGVGKWTGWTIPSHRPNAWVCPSHNPAAVLRGRERDPVLQLDFRRHLRTAAALSGRPWPDGPPDFETAVRPVHDPEEAAAWLRGVTAGLVAFDFETTTLKPDGAGAEIVCCSVCHDGRQTISFPWHGPVHQAMCDLLSNPDVGKIGSNIKFEDRWAREKLGVETRGWFWDTMLAAHALDARAGITSIKFQAFVRLGVGDYNRHVEPFLASREKGGNAVNRIHDVGLRPLLLYCGMDSLLEYEVAVHQRGEMGL